MLFLRPNFKKLKQLQAIIPIAYLVVVFIGMLFEYVRYKVFGINIFQYADVFDFLIAPFKDLTIIYYLIFTILAWFGLHKLDAYFKRFPKFYYYFNFGLSKKKWYQKFTKLSFAFTGVSYVFVSSFFVAGIGKKEVLENKNNIEITYADNEVVTGSLIGKTKEVIFLYTDESVKIIPSISLVKQLSFNKKLDSKKHKELEPLEMAQKIN